MNHREKEIIEKLPEVFGGYRFLNSHTRRNLPLADLFYVRGFEGTLSDGEIIPIYFLDRKDSIDALTCANIFPGHLVASRNSQYTPYTDIKVIMPNIVSVKGCGRIVHTSSFCDLVCVTSDRNNPSDTSSEGGLYALLPSLRTATSQFLVYSLNGSKVKEGIIFAPGIVAMKLPEKVDKAVGCLVVEPTRS